MNKIATYKLLTYLEVLDIIDDVKNELENSGFTFGVSNYDVYLVVDKMNNVAYYKITIWSE